MYPALDYVSPRRERQLRREWKKKYKDLGLKYPRLPTIGYVEVTAIELPIWAQAKAVKGLSVTHSGIWLRRILARELMREDEDAGGTPRVTWTSYRPCKICKRPLIGQEADNRFFLDLKITGEWTVCGPDCVALESSRIESQQKRKRKAIDHGNARVELKRDVRHIEKDERGFGSDAAPHAPGNR